VNAVDTSVVVAAFASWHEHHDVAAAALEHRPHLPAQCALEAYSVLTRLPPPHRVAPLIVRAFLAANFEDLYLIPPPERSASIIGELADRGIGGGAAYDGFIAVTAREAGVTLQTLDQRARGTYDRLGVTVEFLA
jgi:predicted nucleic acid-binding protein